MVEWYHRLNGHEFEQTSGDSEEQRNLRCYSPWGSQKVRSNLATDQYNIVKIIIAVNFYFNNIVIIDGKHFSFSEGIEKIENQNR